MPSHTHKVISGYTDSIANGSQFNNIVIDEHLGYYYGNWAVDPLSYEGGNQSHENRPPYFAVYYIMKIK